jgi:DNA polymerase-3 subunit beta
LVERQGDALSLVATDGHRLAVSTADCQTISPDTQAVMVPVKTMAVLTKLLRRPTSRRQHMAPLPVKVYIRQHDAIFVVGDAVLATTLSEGACPPYKEVIPSIGPINATLATAELINGLERAKVWTSRGVHDGVKLSFTSNMLTISPLDKDLDGAALHVPVADYQGEPLDIGFNPQLLLDGLVAAGAEQVTLNMRANNKPATLRTDKFLYTLMPAVL